MKNAVIYGASYMNKAAFQNTEYWADVQLLL